MLRIQDLVLLLDQLVGYADLVALDCFVQRLAEDLAAGTGAPLGIEGVFHIRRSTRKGRIGLLHVLVGRGVAGVANTVKGIFGAASLLRVQAVVSFDLAYAYPIIVRQILSHRELNTYSVHFLERIGRGWSSGRLPGPCPPPRAHFAFCSFSRWNSLAALRISLEKGCSEAMVLDTGSLIETWTGLRE